MSNSYFHPSVSKKTVSDFMKNTLKGDTEIFAIEVYQKNELMLKLALPPYDCSDKAEVYSLSKSFTSTAIGIAIDNGLLAVEDTVINYFPDDCPENISDNLKSMKVKHLLSMNTGHNECTMLSIEAAENGIMEFFKQDIPFAPGTHFAYNTGATYILSAIITKVTGYSLLDYISIKLFNPLGIMDVEWTKVSNQYTKGGYGIHVSCEDISKLASLYLNDGIYNGKRYISSEWIKTATFPHSDNSDNGTPDWQSGYGYQFWVNARDGFRGDGAFGQLMVILPKYDMTIAIRAESNNMQNEMECVYDLAENLHNNIDEIAEEIAGYPTLNPVDDELIFADKIFICESNLMGIKWISFSKNGDELCFNFSNSEKINSILAGSNRYVKSQFQAKEMKPYLARIQENNSIETIKLASCYSINGTHLDIFCRGLNFPHAENIIIDFDNDNQSIVVKFEYRNELICKEESVLKGVIVS